MYNKVYLKLPNRANETVLLFMTEQNLWGYGVKRGTLANKSVIV